MCANGSCTWGIHSSLLLDKFSWMIKTLKGNHTCPRSKRNRQATSNWLANQMLDEFKTNLHMEVKVMHDRMMRKFGVHIPNHICWRARRILRTIVEGRYDEGYKPLAQYMVEFKERNLSSSCVVNLTEQGPSKNPSFRRYVICIDDAIESFKAHCRPLIGIDTCHLKGPYKGVLMTAIGLDGNNGQFPLAFGVTSIKNKEEWAFLLYNLAIALGAQEDASPYTIISDRHLGIIVAVNEVMPKASRRICALRCTRILLLIF